MEIRNKRVIKVIKLDKVITKMVKQVAKAEKTNKVLTLEGVYGKYTAINYIIKLLKKKLPLTEDAKYNISSLVVGKDTAEIIRVYDKIVLAYYTGMADKKIIDDTYAWHDLAYGLVEVEGLEEGVLYVTEDYLVERDKEGNSND